MQGRPEPGPDEDLGSRWARVSPEMLGLIGQEVVKGRGITAQDTATSPGVALVNEAFVKKFLKHGEEPVGARFGTNGMKSTGDFTIVGVVRNVKWNDPREEVQAMYFRPLLQKAASDPKGEERSFHTGTIMLKTRGPIAGLEALSRKTLTGINPNLPVMYYEAFDEQIALNFTQDRLIAELTLLFSGLALVLASVGLYGVTSYTVARRTSEIGIRMALGAARGNVVMMVLRGAVMQAVIGLVLGVPIAMACVWLLKSQLYEVAGHDLGVIGAAVLALILCCDGCRADSRAACCINGSDAGASGGITGATTMGAVIQDMRFAVRQLMRAPTFALVAVATLALAIGGFNGSVQRAGCDGGETAAVRPAGEDCPAADVCSGGVWAACFMDAVPGLAAGE